MRRRFGPLTGLAVFLSLAALVFTGLGWVTSAALAVERGQREAAARADLANRLRHALWKLDSRMLLALGVEDSRPFYHYAPPDPAVPSAPLLTASLPEWMRLHFQVDPSGWSSPQVVPAEVADAFRRRWPHLELRNLTGDRRAFLEQELRAGLPAAVAYDLFAARDRAASRDDDLPLAAPLLTAAPPPEAPALSGAGNRLPGLLPPAPATSDPGHGDGDPPLPTFGASPSPASRGTTTAPPSPPAVPLPTEARGLTPDEGRRRAGPDRRAANGASGGPGIRAAGRTSTADREADPAWADFLNRAGTLGKGLQEARQASGDAAVLAFPTDPRHAPPLVPPGPPQAAAGPLPSRSVEHEKQGGSLEYGREKVQKAPVPPSTVPSVSPGEDRPTPADPNTTPVAVHLGPMRPQWVAAPNGVRWLVLVRAARLEFRPPHPGQTVYQGVVLDWPRLEAVLRDEVKDDFPAARLVPVTHAGEVSPERTMTALPVQLDPGTEPVPPPTGWTPLRLGLVLAWGAAGVAFAAVGLSGWSLFDLAERRFRFVSAVTHELRTPLTALRLYLDLLTGGLVRDEARRQEYLATLAAECDRLQRLVDNVLDFARLEGRRRSPERGPVPVADLLERLTTTWADRLARDGKQLVVESGWPAGATVTTDPVLVEQIVGNLLDNARKYSRDAADPRVWLRAGPGPRGGLRVEVEDRGPGIPPAERRLVFRPFRRGHGASAGGGVGLGLALARSWAEALGGRLTYRPADGGPGACFRLDLPG